LWLRFFQYGPLEWVWRSLTYWRLQPFKRPAPALPLDDEFVMPKGDPVQHVANSLPDVHG
jgi:hypothetical protein